MFRDLPTEQSNPRARDLDRLDTGALVRLIHEEDASVHVDLTLTSPFCPLGPEIIAEVKTTTLALDGVDKAEVELVWEPAWDPKVDADEDVKALLGIWD